MVKILTKLVVLKVLKIRNNSIVSLPHFIAVFMSIGGKRILTRTRAHALTSWPILRHNRKHLPQSLVRMQFITFSYFLSFTKCVKTQGDIIDRTPIQLMFTSKIKENIFKPSRIIVHYKLTSSEITLNKTTSIFLFQFTMKNKTITKATFDASWNQFSTYK